MDTLVASTYSCIAAIPANLPLLLTPMPYTAP